MTGIFRLQPFRLSMRWLPVMTPSSGFLRTTARRLLLRLLRREHLKTVLSYRPDSPRRLHSILGSYRQSNAPLHRTREPKSWTRNTKSSRTI